MQTPCRLRSKPTINHEDGGDGGPAQGGEATSSCYRRPLQFLQRGNESWKQPKRSASSARAATATTIYVLAGFVAVLLCSNLIGPAKVSGIELPFALPLIGATLVFGVGNIFFPISYIFGDVLTEVYGYARARRVIWAGFMAMVFASVMALVVRSAAYAERAVQRDVAARARVGLRQHVANRGRVDRRVLGRRLRQRLRDGEDEDLTRGRWLWTRTIGSTVIGQGVDSIIFYPIAFAGIWTGQTLDRGRSRSTGSSR